MDFRYLTNQESLGLAPMEGVTDFPTRLWLSLTSRPVWMSTPFLRVTSTYPAKAPPSFIPEHRLSLSSYELLPQIMTASADDFCKVAEKWLLKSRVVDLNAGCPSPRCERGGAGASLLKDPDRLFLLLTKIISRLGAGCLSVKVRVGFESKEEFLGLLEVFKGLDLHHLTVHGRTKAQKYTGESDWDMIALAQKKMPFTVVGSGDILCGDDFSSKAKKVVTKGIIGRGALKNPFVFEEIRRGEALSVGEGALKYSLACYSLLNFLAQNELEKLCCLVEEGVFINAPLADEDKWQRLFNVLAKAAGQKKAAPEDLGSDRGNLSRTKMVWSHLRPTLKEAYQKREVLRSRSYREFFGWQRGGQKSVRAF